MGIYRLATRAGDLKNTTRNPCLTDPETRAAMGEEIRRNTGWAARSCPPFYFVADENSLGHYSSAHDFCQSPTCLAAFRQVLRQRYGALSGLNQAWRREYTTWDEVTPDTFEEAKARGCFVAWIEHRRFMFSVFTDAMALEKQLVTSVDPVGRLAVSGMGMPSVHNGFDWYGMSQHLDHIVCYLRPYLTDVLRSFARPGMTLSAWNGYAGSYEALRQRVWHQVLNGFHHPSYWYHRFMIRHGDGALSPAGREFQSIIREVRDSGVGRLLTGASWHPSPVGIHYSTAALISAHVTGTTTPLGDTVFEANLNGWAEVLRDMGVQPPRCFSTEQLLAGELTATAVKVFVLPLSQALADGEVEALSRFVAAGGILVADGRPGVLTEAGVQRQENALHAVFGVQFSSEPFERARSSITVATADGERTCSLSPLEKGLDVRASTALGSSPGLPGTRPVRFGGLNIRSKPGTDMVRSFIVNRHGKGAAIYLNALLDDYGDLRTRGNESRPVVEALQRALAAAGFEPEWQAALPPGTELIRYDHGLNSYVALCRTLNASKEYCQFRLALGETKYICDVTGDHRGEQTATVQGILAPGDARVFALLPAAPAAPELSVTWQRHAIVGSVRLNDAAGQPMSGAARLRVLDAGGEERIAYTSNLLVTEGQAELRIPLGLDETGETWRVVVRDVVTGKETTADVRLGTP